MLRYLTTCCAAALPALATQVLAQPHSGDIILTVEEGRIVTNGTEPIGGSLIPGLRAFGAEFGEVIPNFTSEPGFDCEPGTFPANGAIGFELLDCVRRWDGGDFDAVAGRTISIEFGPLGPVDSPALPGAAAPGFVVPVQSNGQWHRHYDFVIDDGAEPGVYLLTLRLTSDSGHLPSDRFYLVFGQNTSEEVHAAAIIYARDVLAWEGPAADVTRDGVVNAHDLASVLGAWGTSNLREDVNDDGIVNAADLAALLGAWGSGGEQ